VPLNPFPYAPVFAAIEQQVISLGSERLPREQVTNQLNQFKGFATRSISDTEYFSILVFVAFYSGFKASTVTSRRPVIERHFPNWQVVAEYGESDIRRILDDPNMIAHERKIRACVANARTFSDIVGRHGSFKAFVNQNLPSDSFEDLLLLKELLKTTFAYLGGITVYHFMTDIGLNLLKPDRVICRLFHRPGLLDNKDQLLKSIMEGHRFADATGLPIRYIDIVLVVFGQVASPKLGISQGVCLNTPRCRVCAIRQHCRFSASAKGGGGPK
jgi:DNA-3-methyladenine glycosylase I